MLGIIGRNLGTVIDFIVAWLVRIMKLSLGTGSTIRKEFSYINALPLLVINYHAKDLGGL